MRPDFAVSRKKRNLFRISGAFAMATACVPPGVAASIGSRRLLSTSGFPLRAHTRVSRGINRNGALCVTAAAVGDDIGLSQARARSLPLSTALDASSHEAVPTGPVVFALLDGAGEDATVTYVGVSKRAAEDVEAIAAHLSSKDIATTHVCFDKLPATARKPKLKAALGAWLEQNGGGVPVGNEALAQSSQTSEQSSQQKGETQKASSFQKSLSSSAALQFALSAITNKAIDDLCRDGFVVLDDILPNETLKAAQASCENLRTNGKMKHVGQEGRDDDIIVLDAENLPKQNSKYGGLTSAVQVLLAFPEALRTATTPVESATGAATPTGAEKPSKTKPAVTRRRLKTVTPPKRLMLAHYAGDTYSGAKYVSHLDNDPSDPGYEQGEPGLRACDRSVTAILYLNEHWEESHGGCLRIVLENRKGNVDVAPSWGRVVLFDSRRIEHEVLPSFEKRYALTAWLKDADVE